jgi:aspartyl-tRNA(Asn)/glutamyl-tRNA(Gln) amidotransferase subunit B
MNISELIDRAITSNPDVVARYRKGAKSASAFLVGRVMRDTNGLANPVTVNRLTLEKLDKAL